MQPSVATDSHGREGCGPVDAQSNVDEAEGSQVRRPWTPEPEPYDPETYVAWGRKHYGEEWYELRNALFRERLEIEYTVRQRELRRLEREKEGRTLAGELAKVGLKEIRIPAVMVRPAEADDDAVSDRRSLSTGYSTYLATDDERSPEPEDPWERLEWRREHYDYDEQLYQRMRVELRVALEDKVRSQREREERDKRDAEAWAEIVKWKGKNDWKYEALKRDHNLMLQGWTQEQIDAEKREQKEMRRRARREPHRPVTGPLGGREKDAEEGDMTVAQWREIAESALRRGGYTSSSSSEPELPPQSQTPNEEVLRKTRAGRITKTAPKNQSIAKRNNPRQPKSTSTRAEVRSGARKTRKREPKVYKKERESRRLAGLSPEYGMLPKRGEAPEPYEAPLHHPSSGRKPSRLESRGRSASKKTKNVNAQRVSKPTQHRPSRQKGSKRLYLTDPTDSRLILHISVPRHPAKQKQDLVYGQVRSFNALNRAKTGTRASEAILFANLGLSPWYEYLAISNILCCPALDTPGLSEIASSASHESNNSFAPGSMRTCYIYALTPSIVDVCASNETIPTGEDVDRPEEVCTLRCKGIFNARLSHPALVYHCTQKHMELRDMVFEKPSTSDRPTPGGIITTRIRSSNGHFRLEYIALRTGSFVFSAILA
ncbi:hypothetical protein FQN50_003021 [Emmonsiellopsis sp. PD_5]|nr:hypothetical protein FQN50_003021 [Emmonsiellopsis sp. PD_5]